MADIRMRPQFDFDVSCDHSDSFRRLAEALEGTDEVIGKVFADSAILKIPENENHLWTPELKVSVEKSPAGGCRIHGLLGPKPGIWSLFVASYVAWTFIAVMSLIVGSSQATLSQSAWAFWGTPAAMVGILVTYVTARFGRRIGRPQSRRLKVFLEQSIRQSP
jgi:hypothetical protein